MPSRSSVRGCRSHLIRSGLPGSTNYVLSRLLPLLPLRDRPGLPSTTTCQTCSDFLLPRLLTAHSTASAASTRQTTSSDVFFRVAPTTCFSLVGSLVARCLEGLVRSRHSPRPESPTSPAGLFHLDQAIPTSGDVNRNSVSGAWSEAARRRISHDLRGDYRSWLSARRAADRRLSLSAPSSRHRSRARSGRCRIGTPPTPGTARARPDPRSRRRVRSETSPPCDPRTGRSSPG